MVCIKNYLCRHRGGGGNGGGEYGGEGKEGGGPTSYLTPSVK